MEVVTIKDLPPKAGPYPGITQFFIANHDNGYDKFEIMYSETIKGNVGHMHSHPHSEHMQLVLEGSLRILGKDGTTYEVPAGSAILIHPGEAHEVYNTYDGTTRYLVVYADPR